MANTESDCLEERFGGGDTGNDQEEDDYEITEGRYNTTLRKSACFTLQQFSKVLREETLKEFMPAFEKAVALQWPMQTFP